MKPCFSILLLEDDPQFAQWALKELQRDCAEFEVKLVCGLAQASEWLGTEAAQFMKMAIVDLHIGKERSAELIKELTQVKPDVPVLVLTALDHPSEAIAAIQAGAQGYLIKSTFEGELGRAVRQVLAGGSPINPGFANYLLGAFRLLANAHDADPIQTALEGLSCKLSSRESEVLKLVARGYSDKEVAANLLIAPSTVDTHVRAIFRKFSVHSRAQLRRAIGF